MTSTSNNPSKGWIVLSHGHKPFPEIGETEIVDALPARMRDGPRERMRFQLEQEVAKDPMQIDWEALQNEQDELFTRLLLPLRSGDRGIAYFGRAFLPLAFDLGFRVEKWVPSTAFQYHTQKKSWQWPGPSPDTPTLEVIVDDNLPRRPSAATGPVIVRVSVTARIASEDAIARVPSPVSDIEIHLGPACGTASIGSIDDLERVARKFEETLVRIREFYPQAGPIHLFAAVPASLAFRMGTLINKNVHREIQTYHFIPNAATRYQRALIIGNRGRSRMKVRIQFLTAEPDSTQRIRADRELREIVDRLRDGEHREQFDLIEPRTAVRVKDLLTYIRRDQAQIVHFSGHGEENGYLLLEDRAGNPARVAPDSLRHLFDTWNDDEHVRCVIFNACHSNDLARALTRQPAVVPCAIGTTRAVSDKAALCFSEGFYGAIADGVTLAKSFESGKVQVGLEVPSEAELFQLEVADESLRDKPLFDAP